MPKFFSLTKINHTIQHIGLFRAIFNQNFSWRLVFAFAVVCLFVVNLVILNNASVRGYQLKTLQKNIDVLKKDNQAMNLEVSDLSSPKLLEESARMLGMVPVEEIFYLSPTSGAVAAR